MVKALFDTNILIDYLNGHEEARNELSRYTEVAISMITWMEVMAGATDLDRLETESFLQSFELLPVDMHVARRAVEIRQAKRVKLPDAIIWATAQENNLLLVTRNPKDFHADEPGVRIPYQLQVNH
ncbi:type II toxin-antitoxin system VapC family toxin [Iodobacter sp. HSC-16F04]|uniref:Ribonuclease VapC n=1 Tax=Iodobacter violaceini TaxID=3044271 RepID=A0ABX0KSR9_9NEIS|nr:type II toxin-antitoxin system VapC family toxin [Iodobacter violacea]NHQ86769.1 type II toxin-antitoxin system VapC family toxin [Iodobacter violacea]